MKKIDYSIGMPVGLVPVNTGTVVTEIEAIQELFNVKATAIGAGGLGETQGSISLLIEGEDSKVNTAFEAVKQIKGEPTLSGVKQNCPCKHNCG